MSEVIDGGPAQDALQLAQRNRGSTIIAVRKNIKALLSIGSSGLTEIQLIKTSAFIGDKPPMQPSCIDDDSETGLAAVVEEADDSVAFCALASWARFALWITAVVWSRKRRLLWSG